jgi:hypothetical protein
MEIDDNTSDQAPIASVVGAVPDNTQINKATATKNKKIANKTKTTADKSRRRKAFAHTRARILRRADIPRRKNPRQIEV